MGATAGKSRPMAERSQGDADASPDASRCPVEQLFELHADRLRRYVYRFTRSWETAQDLVHDVFLRLWDKRDDFATVTDPEGYLYAAARNRALTWLRQRRLEDQWHQQYAAPDVNGGRVAPPDPAQLLLKAEMAAALQRAVDGLPERQREVLMLQWKGRSYQQIGSLLGISLKTVSNHLTRATDHLRRNLTRRFG